MPRLSVVVPCYNVQAFVLDTLRSLARNAAERPGEIEFLLVDDCSTDATPRILKEWQDRLPGATVIHHEQNRGLSGTRNTGIEAATGDYLTFLDGDDWYGPRHLSDLIDAMDRFDCDFVRTDIVHVTGRKREVQRAPAPVRNEVLNPRDLISPPNRTTMVDYPYTCCGAYRRPLFDGGRLRFSERLRTAEDRPWIWELFLTTRSFAAVGLPGVFYRRGVSTSLTQITDERQLDYMPALDQVLDLLADDPDRDLLLPKAVRTYCALTAHHLRKSTWAPETAALLRTRAAAALGRIPQDALTDQLNTMDAARSTLLRGLLARKGAL